MEPEILTTKSNRNPFEEALIAADTQNISHAHDRSLFKHLTNVANQLKDWSLDQDTVTAGLFHSVYSTEFFPIEVWNRLDRSKLQDLIGEKAEKLVYLFCSAKRETLRFTNGQWQFQCRWSQQTNFLSTHEAYSFFHILVANQLDHISGYAFFTQRHSLKIFKSVLHVLNPKAQESLKKIWAKDRDSKKARPADCKIAVRFIAHAGIEVSAKNTSLLIDPWLFSSDFQNPVLKGFVPKNQTIDFAFPEPLDGLEDFSPDIILLSHFHTHHAPSREIRRWIERQEKIIIGCPEIPENFFSSLKKDLGSLMNKVDFQFFKSGDQRQLLDCQVTAFDHPQKNHLAWRVESSGSSILHIADSSLNKNRLLRQIDPLWYKMKNLSPDILFISCANQSKRAFEGLDPFIIEHSTLSPAQAAELTKFINPKVAVPIGFYNFSIWKNRVEYGFHAGEIEQQFHWALSFLSPEISCFNLKPSNTFEIYEKNGKKEIFLLASRS